MMGPGPREEPWRCRGHAGLGSVQKTVSGTLHVGGGQDGSQPAASPQRDSGAVKADALTRGPAEQGMKQRLTA